MSTDTPKHWTDRVISEYSDSIEHIHIECEEGWSVLIYPILDMIERHNTAFPKHKISVDQVKEKWGAMRFYISMSVPSPEHDDLAEADSYSHIQGAIALAEKVSLSLCEKCGQRGEIVKGSWLKVRCPSCKQGEQQPQPQWTWGSEGQTPVSDEQMILAEIEHQLRMKLGMMAAEQAATITPTPKEGAD